MDDSSLITLYCKDRVSRAYGQALLYMNQEQWEETVEAVRAQIDPISDIHRIRDKYPDLRR